MTTQDKVCPKCGHHNPTTSQKCEQCQTELAMPRAQDAETQPNTKPINTPQVEEQIQTLHIDSILNDDETLKTGKAIMQGDLMLTVLGSDKTYRIPNAQLQEVVIGRRNPDTGYQPTVDLADVEGHKYGVSRRHATLNRRDNLIVLTDHTSVNGTYLNGKRVMPEQPRVVRDSDLIKLGKLELIVSFQKPT